MAKVVCVTTSGVLSKLAYPYWMVLGSDKSVMTPAIQLII